MLKRFVLTSLFLVASTPLAQASVIYDVTVDTSSISGVSGSLDFNFSPGPLLTQAADLQILNFTSDGTLADCATNVQGFCPTGDVTGALPGPLTFDNGAYFNDYFDGFTYGNSLSFDVMLYGPAIDSPDGVSTSGSAFAFSMFSDAAGTMPALTTDLFDGYAATISINLDGSTTVSNSSMQTTITPVGDPDSAPEPRDLVLTGIGLIMIASLARARTRRTQQESI